MNILIVKLSAIGDVVHTLPSLSAVRKLYPQAHISWAIEESASDIIRNHPCLDRVIISYRKRWIHNLLEGRETGKTLGEIRTFLKTLRDRPYDLVIDFHGLFKSALIVFLARGKRKLGYDSMQEMSGLFLTEKIPEDMGKHAVDRYLDFARYLGAPEQEPEFIIPVEEENRKRIETLLSAANIAAGQRFAAVNPVALWETKMWPDEKFAALGDMIIRELGIPIVFTGAQSDGPIRHIRSLMKSPSVDLAGRTSLRDLAYLYSLSSLVITTDSGPMHIAAAMGTPVVALFGPTSPARTGPYGEGHAVIRKNMKCSPCFLKWCETRRCMEDISIGEVFQAVREKVSAAQVNTFPQKQEFKHNESEL